MGRKFPKAQRFSPVTLVQTTEPLTLHQSCIGITSRYKPCVTNFDALGYIEGRETQQKSDFSQRAGKVKSNQISRILNILAKRPVFVGGHSRLLASMFEGLVNE